MSTHTAKPSAEIDQGIALLTQGDLAGAERAAQSVLARGNNSGALHLLGMIRARQNRLEEAAELLGRALALQPGQPQMLFNYGKLLALLGRDAEAAKTLEAAAQALPNYPEAWNTLAGVQGRMGNIAGTEKSLRKVLALQPKHTFAKLSLGTLLNGTERAAEAEIVLAQGLAEALENTLRATFAYHLGLAQLELGKREAALENFTRVRSFDPEGSAGMDFNRANILVELSRIEEAETMLQEMVRRDPGNAQAHLSYNRLLHGEKKEKKFLSSFDGAPQTTDLQLSKASLLVTAGRDEEAQEIYARLLAAEPDNVMAANGLAEGLSKLGRHAEAVAGLEKALARLPGNPALESGIAAAALRGRDPQKAAAMALKVLARAPHDQLMLALLGSSWRLMDDTRHETLNGYDDLIQIFDLEAPDGYSDMAAFNAELNEFLSGLHKARHRDEIHSARGGSMTFGSLFNARYPLVEKLRHRFNEAMTRYIAALKPDLGHPFLTRRGQGFRYDGSWSSRLAASGYHANHIHYQSWISSAYYVDVPQAAKDTKAQEGWIKFGEPAFDLGMKPRRTVQPVPGRLVLFPSYMWHGTIPFQGETRTTIAFDATPR
jgi:predicted Zn-dependent protease